MSNSSSVPASYLREYEFAGGEVTALAKLAAWIPGDPNRLYTFAAREVQVGDLELYPPSTYSDDEAWSELRAYTVYDGIETVVYYLENWREEAHLNFTACYAITELHELSHWAAPVEDNEQDPDHWERWNVVLQEVVEYVMGVEADEETDVTPATPAADTPPETEQVTLGGVCDG